MLHRIKRGLLFSFIAFVLQLPSYATADQVFGQASVSDGAMLNANTIADIDYPKYRHMKNVGGSDGSGLCVFTSIEHAFDWHGMKEHLGFRKWMERRQGGGWPEKVTRELRAYCQEKRIEMPDILQVTNGNLDLLAEAVQSGHMAGITYCYSPTGRYGGATIAHMVNCMAARVGPNKLWAVMDNNYPGSYEWMDEPTLNRIWRNNGGGWFVIVLNRPDPPPIPRNGE